jgi:hypothetical protein
MNITIQLFRGDGQSNLSQRTSHVWKLSQETSKKESKDSLSLITNTVTNSPPINPSHVFLGDNLINGVFPKKKPAIYAKISLHTTKQEGNTNHINPSKILLMIK